MRILLTNNSLAIRGGTDLYIRDVAIELMRRGHEPVVYCTHLGEVADEIRAATVPVIDRIERLGSAPDVIHAHHQYDTLSAMVRFPRTPVVSFCHGWVPWEEAPLRFPQIVRYIAVSEVCRERLIAEGGIAPERIHLIHNFFDPALFPARAGLPARPRSALCLTNNMTELSISVLRAACEEQGIQFCVRGRAVANPERQPGSLMAAHDVVFARGRTAVEAMASGAATILCDEGRLGPMVSPANFAGLRNLNFAMRSLRDPLTVEGVSERLSRYDSAACGEVSERVRVECAIGPAVDRLEEVYGLAREEWKTNPSPCPENQARALARFLEDSAPVYKHSMLVEERRTWMTCEERHSRELAEERRRRTQLEAELAALKGSASWRWSQAFLRNGAVNRVCGRLIRRVANAEKPR